MKPIFNLKPTLVAIDGLILEANSDLSPSVASLLLPRHDITSRLTSASIDWTLAKVLRDHMTSRPSTVAAQIPTPLKAAVKQKPQPSQKKLASHVTKKPNKLPRRPKWMEATYSEQKKEKS